MTLSITIVRYRVKIIKNKDVSFHKHFDCVDSTQDCAQTMLPATHQSKIAIISASRQKKGRGRRGRTFFSTQEKGLWVSIIVPIKELGDHFQINQALSLALLSAVNDRLQGKKVEIKWPNDLYISDKKVAGLLLESRSSYPTIIAGFGLNVNFTVDDFPEELQTIATSLLIESSQENNLSDILFDIIMHFIHFKRLDKNEVHRYYLDNVKGVGRMVSIEGQIGLLIGVAPTGSCKILMNNEEREFQSGTLRFIEH